MRAVWVNAKPFRPSISAGAFEASMRDVLDCATEAPNTCVATEEMWWSKMFAGAVELGRLRRWFFEFPGIESDQRSR